VPLRLFRQRLIHSAFTTAGGLLLAASPIQPAFANSKEVITPKASIFAGFEGEALAGDPQTASNP